MDLFECKTRLSEAGVRFDQGLTCEELSQIERDFGFVFPPDLRAFLVFALPISPEWPDWRRGRHEIAARIAKPIEDICNEVDNGFWVPSWGPKPETQIEAYGVVSALIARAPRLIPFWKGYIPDRPFEVGNPVFSIHQGIDIIHCGANLFDFLHNVYSSHFGRSRFKIAGEIRQIEFWSELVEANAGSC